MRPHSRLARSASELGLGAVIAAAILWNSNGLFAPSAAEAAGPGFECAAPAECPDTYICCGNEPYCP